MTTDPGGPGHEDREPEPEPRRASLKDRLAACQGASSSPKNFQQRHKNDSQLQDHMRATGSGVDSIKEDDENKNENDEVGDNEERIVDFAPVKSLRERMAAFQGGDGSSEAEPATTSLEDEDSIYEDASVVSSMSVKERMALYQNSKSCQSGRPSPSMKTKEPMLKDYQKPAVEKGSSSLQERIAVFGKVKSAAASKKETSDLQSRIAKFSNAASTLTSSSIKVKQGGKLPPKIKMPSHEAGTGFCDRMAKYRETAAPGAEADAFVAAKKKPQVVGAKKRQSFVTKKPSGDLQKKIAMYAAGASTEGGGKCESPVKKERPAERIATGGLEGRLSAYQASLVSPGAAVSRTNKKESSFFNALTSGVPSGRGGREEEKEGRNLEATVEILAVEPLESEGGKLGAGQAGRDEDPLSVALDDMSPEAAKGKKFKDEEEEDEKCNNLSHNPKELSTLEDEGEEEESNLQNITKGLSVDPPEKGEKCNMQLEVKMTASAEKLAMISEEELDKASRAEMCEEENDDASSPISSEKMTEELQSENGPEEAKQRRKLEEAEEMLREKKTEEERRRKHEEAKRARAAERAKAELDALDSETAEADKWLEDHRSLVASASAEVKERELNTKSAEANMKTMESKMKKGGILKKDKRRKAYENAAAALGRARGLVWEAKERLALAERDVKAAEAEANARRRERDATASRLDALTSGPSSRPEA